MFRNAQERKPGGLSSLMRYVFFLVNFIIFVSGILAFVAGIWTLVGNTYLTQLIDNELFKSAGSIIMLVGVITGFVAFLGCFGVLKEMRVLIVTYFAIMVVLFLIALIGGIIAFLFRTRIQKTICSDLKHTMPFYKNNSLVTSTWDTVQIGFKCCGSAMFGNETGWQAWAETRPDIFGGDVKVPKSCCKKGNETVLTLCQSNPGKSNAYVDDCCKKLKIFISKHARIIGGLGLGIAVAVVSGVAISCALLVMY